MAEPAPKADGDLKREMQHAALRWDIGTARPLKEIVLGEIRNGVRPEWIAIKYAHYGVTLDRVLTAKAVIEKQEEAKRERVQSTSGDRTAFEGREVDHIS